jgi:ribosomal-protein-alanine N-acetyltransferase
MIELRELKNDDRDLLVRYLNNEQVVRYLSSKIPQPYTFEDATWWTDFGSKEGAVVKAIVADDVLCGVIGAYKQDFEYSHAVELGYWLAQDFWNQGIATKAVTEFTDWLFSTSDIQRIYNPVSAPNIASIKVMEKAGYTLEGVLRRSIRQHGYFYDEHLFAKVRA